MVRTVQTSPGRQLFIQAIARFAVELPRQLDGAGVVDLRGRSAAGHIAARDVNRDTALAGHDAVVAVMIDVELRVDGQEFVGAAGEAELAHAVGLAFREEIVQVDATVVIVELYFHVGGGLAVTG